MSGFYAPTLGSRWEGVHGWRPALRALDWLAEAAPAVDLPDLKTRSGKWFPPSDGTSVAELLAAALTNLSAARPIWIGPTQLTSLPGWSDDEEALAYAREARPPFELTFLDCTDASGNPAHVTQQRSNDNLAIGLYGALVYSPPADDPGRAKSVFPPSSLVVIPFGSRIEDRAACNGMKRQWSSLHADRELLPAAAPIGFVQIGGRPFGHDEPIGLDARRLVLGEWYWADRGPAPRPVIGICHVVPLAHDAWVIVGSGALATRTITALGTDIHLGPQRCPEQSVEYALAEATIVGRAAQAALSALYLLDSTNVTLTSAKVSRQVRRRTERTGGGIALTVRISSSSRAGARKRVRAGGREFSHSFEVRGHYRHVTHGSHVRNPDHLKPCPRCGMCRREYVPPHVVDAGDGKPFVPKARRIT